MLKNLQEIMGGGAEHALVRIWSGDFSEAEAAAMHRRAQSDPKYREELHGSMEVLAAMESLADDDECLEIVRDCRRVLREHRLKRRGALGVAAALVVAVGALVTSFSPWRGPDDSQLPGYFTRIGEQQAIELQDGSVVTLNTAGQLAVDYGEEVRRIVLQRGEAFFEVSEDPVRPFTVDLGVRSVTAVGTTFNVRKYPDLYQVAVIEGAVAFHGTNVLGSVQRPGAVVPWSTSGAGPQAEPKAPAVGHFHGTNVSGSVQRPGAQAAITPAQQRVEEGWVAEFDVSRGVFRAFQPESMERYGSWRSGMLSFYREPLYEVVQELNRYSRKKILIEDDSVKDLTVYTALSIREIDSALDGLDHALPIEVTEQYDRIVITGAAEK